MPDMEWTVGSLHLRWKNDIIATEWTVAFSTLTISHLSTEYVLIPLQVIKTSLPYNPTGDIVQFAFMPNAVQQPTVSDWVNGSWETVTTNIIYPYNAKCLIGPSGSTALTQGDYVIFVKITDNPEVPVLTCGQLEISLYHDRENVPWLYAS